jgi:hypothetical protein
MDTSRGVLVVSEHHKIRIRGYTVVFHAYTSAPDLAARVARLAPFFSRLPDAHLAVLYPIFIMLNKPGGRAGGGTWPSGIVAANFMGAAQSANTGIPPADIKLHALSRRQGIIGLSEDRWGRPMGRLEFTVMHEVGHCVHNALGGVIPTSGSPPDFRGMRTDRCGASDLTERRAVEAYARYICRPHGIAHDPVPGETDAETNRRLIGELRRSPAFLTVPASWRPV